jgi:hypothetical protein
MNVVAEEMLLVSGINIAINNRSAEAQLTQRRRNLHAIRMR